MKYKSKDLTPSFTDDWKKLPIPDVSMDKQRAIVELVDKILTLRRANSQADITQLEEDVDRMVSAVYGLNDNTIAVSMILPPLSMEAHITQAIGIKELLRDHVLTNLRAEGPYFSVEALKKRLEQEKQSVESSTLNRYLVELVEAGFLFDAGRGWYSFLKDPAVLSPEPVADLVANVRAAFPLLRFAAWSTTQFNPWLHHLVGQPVIVLDVEKDAMNDVAGHLETRNWKVAFNPRGSSSEHFAPQSRVVVLRALHSAAPEAPEGCAGPVIELRLEVDALSLLSIDEYRAMATRFVTGQRVATATLLRYAAKRRLDPEDIFENQLAALFKEFADN